MTTSSASEPAVSPSREAAGGASGQVAGRALLVVAALIAAGTAGFELARLGGSSDATLIVGSWRTFGLIVFAGLFALVAWRPTSYPGVLELSILHKVAVTLVAVNNTQAADAWGVAVVDGLIAIALIAGYLLLGCYRAWKPARTAARPSAKDQARQGRKSSPAGGRTARPGSGAQGGSESQGGSGTPGSSASQGSGPESSGPENSGPQGS